MAVELTALISAVAISFGAITGFANLIMMGFLTHAIHRHSIRSAGLEALRHNSAQWRQLNLAAIQTPRLQALLDGDQPICSDDRHMLRNVLFYILNGLHEVFLAAKAGILKDEDANQIIRQQISALALHASEVETLFALARGYDAAFATLVRNNLRV